MDCTSNPFIIAGAKLDIIRLSPHLDIVPFAKELSERECTTDFVPSCSAFRG